METHDLSTLLEDLTINDDDQDQVVTWYANSLTSNKEFYCLNIFTVMIKDCDNHGNLKKTQNTGRDYIYVKFYGVENKHQEKCYFLNCETCEIRRR